MARTKNRQQTPEDLHKEHIEALIVELDDLEVPKEAMADLMREIEKRSLDTVKRLGPPYKLKIYEPEKSDDPTMFVTYPHGVMWRIHKMSRLAPNDPARKKGSTHRVDITLHAQLMFEPYENEVFDDKSIMADYIRRAKSAFDHDDRTLKPKRDKEKAKADKFWQPWRQLYRQCLDDGMKPTKAIAHVGNVMTERDVVNRKTGQPYSEPTLWKQLRKTT